VQWLGQNYNFVLRKDPVPGWQEWKGPDDLVVVPNARYRPFLAPPLGVGLSVFLPTPRKSER
jgi:hypothetical protein